MLGDRVDYQEVLIAYLAMLCREIFIRNFFVRLFVLDDLLARIRRLIVTYFEDPNYVPRIGLLLNQASRDTILLEEILAYLTESLDEIRLPPPSQEPVGRRLQKVVVAACTAHPVIPMLKTLPLADS